MSIRYILSLKCFVITFTHNLIPPRITCHSHMSETVAVPPWRRSAKGSRQFAMAYMGSLGVTSKRSRELRKVLQKNCRIHSDCNFVGLSSHESRVKIFANDKGNDSGPYADATFCLMPGGDYPTRKAVVDSLLAGCIPVTFNPYTAILQWPWHWRSVENAKMATHFVRIDDMVQNPEREFERLVLLSKNTSFVSQKRKKIAQIGHRMQYSAPMGLFTGQVRVSASSPSASGSASIVNSIDSVFKNDMKRGGDGNGAYFASDAVNIVLKNILFRPESVQYASEFTFFDSSIPP